MHVVSILIVVFVSSVFAFDLTTSRSILEGLQKSRVLPLRDPRNGFTLFSLNSSVLLPTHKFSPAQSLAAQEVRLSLLELRNETDDAYSFDLVLTRNSENAFSKPNGKSATVMNTQIKPPQELLRLYDLVGDELTKVTLLSLISGTTLEISKRLPTYLFRHRGVWLKYCAKAAVFSWILAQQHLSLISKDTQIWQSLHNVLDSHDKLSRALFLTRAMGLVQRKVDYVDGFSAHMALFYIFSYIRYYLALRADFLQDVSESWEAVYQPFDVFVDDAIELAERSLKSRKLLFMMGLDAYLTMNDMIVPRYTSTLILDPYRTTIIKSIIVYTLPIQSESVVTKAYMHSALQEETSSILVYTNYAPKDSNAFMQGIKSLFEGPISFAKLKEYLMAVCQGGEIS